jgi:hypothetical protein
MIDKNMLDKLDHKMQVMFAVFCAKQVLLLVKEEHKEVAIKAIEAAEGFVEGKVSKEECHDAAYAAYAAAYAVAYAAYAAAYAVAYAADAAAYAAYAAAYAAYAVADHDRKAIEQEQIRYYNELLNFDKIVEDLMGISL